MSTPIVILPPANIVVLGAGVVGLTTALVLSRTHPNASITVCARHMPGDYDAHYTSPWAGANAMPVSPAGSVLASDDHTTFRELWRLATTDPRAGIHVQDTFIYNRAQDAASTTAGWFSELLKPDPWFARVVPEFRALAPHELPHGVAAGTKWKSVCINPAVYLAYLVSQLRARGVELRRGSVAHVCDAARMHHRYHRAGRAADVVVNCTGLLAARLGGVADGAVVPARGQIVLVRNPAPAMYSVSGTDDGDDEAAYIMTRAAGGGTVLGGCYQKGSWDAEVDPAMAKRIMQRCIDLCPQLVKPGEGIEGLDVIRHCVGLRPVREGGPRIEGEVIDGVKVVHNYGAGGFGYQASYGMAERAVRCVEEMLKDKARL